jgi:hypothetical protein
MLIELLHINDCPNTALTESRLRAALVSLGLEKTPILRTELTAATSVIPELFAGSPTVLVNNQDLFPTENRSSELACRVYPTAGGLAGAPTEEQLRDAIAEQLPPN